MAPAEFRHRPRLERTRRRQHRGVAEKLLTVGPDPSDGRAKRVRLTAKGRRFIDAALAASASLEAETAARIGATAMRQHLAALDAALEDEPEKSPERPSAAFSTTAPPLSSRPPVGLPHGRRGQPSELTHWHWTKVISAGPHFTPASTPAGIAPA